MSLFGKPQQVLVQVDANLAWEVFQDPQSGRWIGVCRPLNLNAVGETWIDFQQAAAEALQLLLIDLFEDGELEAFLRHNNWHPKTALPAPGTAVPRFDVPFSVERKTRLQELLAAGV